MTNFDEKLSDQILKTVNILKGKSAIEKYGEKGKNGVVEINTKNPTLKINEVQLKDTIPQEKTDNIIFSKVESEPQFPGGTEEWKKYLRKNLDLSAPKKNNATEGTYTVYVRFIVDSNGFLSDIKALTHNGFGIEAEAIRLISKGPRWKPAIQNGIPVNAYHTKTINFVVSYSKTTKLKKSEKFADPQYWDYDDPEFKKWRQKAISEVIDHGQKRGQGCLYL
ncbi:MAG: energy transducer TonB [Chitinophagales bacterium]|nr:energy transducer TonB [Chitinophagales bacterium]